MLPVDVFIYHLILKLLNMTECTYNDKIEMAMYEVYIAVILYCMSFKIKTAISLVLR